MGQSGSESSCDATPGPSNKRRETVIILPFVILIFLECD
jgi:hypothetical protein